VAQAQVAALEAQREQLYRELLVLRQGADGVSEDDAALNGKLFPFFPFFLFSPGSPTRCLCIQRLYIVHTETLYLETLLIVNTETLYGKYRDFM
jgi:hypothetical protein